MGVGESQISFWSFYDWSLISSSCPWGLLKVSSEADVPIPAADDAGRFPASQLKSPFQGYSESHSKHFLRRHNAANTTTSLSIKQHFFRKSESLILFETAPAATFLHRRPLHCCGNYHSCTGDHFPTGAATSSAPVETSGHFPAPANTSSCQSCTSDHLPAPADTSVHFLAPADTSSRQFCTSDYHIWTSDHFPAPATTNPEPVTSFLHQQLPILNQWPLSYTSRHQQLSVLNQRPLYYTSRHQQLPVLNQWPLFLHQQTPATTNPEPVTTFLHQQTPATNSPEPVTTFLHQQTPATTSSGPANTFLHQQIPVLNQRPPIQRIPVLYQLSRPAPATRSRSTDHPPAAAIVRRTPFRFTIRHNKIWPFGATPLFCQSCLVRCQSLIFQKFAGTGIFIWPPQQTYTSGFVPNLSLVNK